MKFTLLLGLVVGLLELSCVQSVAPVRDREELVPPEPAPLTREREAEVTKEILASIGPAPGRPVVTPFITCENGPKPVEHRDGLTQYWPTITKHLCDGLPCTGKCEAKIKQTLGRYVIAYIITYRPVPSIRILGWRYVKYETHRECECVGCSQFNTFEKCQCQDGCPGFKPDRQYQDSFCQWEESEDQIVTKPGFQYLQGNCTCCKIPRYCRPNHAFSRSECACKCLEQTCRRPRYFNKENCRCECPKIKCPPHHILDQNTCTCVCRRFCPPNTVLDRKRCACIGECREITNSRQCTQVNCRDRPDTSCRLDTIGRCHCPEPTIRNCSDIRDIKTCVNTQCPTQPEFTCRYDLRHGCFCPCCYPRTDPPNYNCAGISYLGPARCEAVNGGKSCGWLCP